MLNAKIENSTRKNLNNLLTWKEFVELKVKDFTGEKGVSVNRPL